MADFNKQTATIEEWIARAQQMVDETLAQMEADAKNDAADNDTVLGDLRLSKSTGRMAVLAHAFLDELVKKSDEMTPEQKETVVETTRKLLFQVFQITE